MIVDRKKFAEILRHVDSVISGDAADVYKLTRLFASGGRVFAAGTDGDIMVVARCECDGDIPEICMDSRTLLGVVRNAPGDNVNLEIEGTQAIISSGKSRFKLGWLTAEMPEFSYSDDGSEFEIDGVLLSDVLRRVKYAASVGQGRHYLEGVHFHAVDGTLRVAAMDGHRLAFADLGVETDCCVTLPTKTVGILSALTEPLKLKLGVRGMSVNCSGVTIMSKVIADDFADYQRILPSGGHKIVFSGNELRRAAQRVGMVMTEKTRVVRVALDGSAAIISSVAQTANEAMEEIPCSGGAGLEVGINIKYLNDALASFGDVDIEMFIVDTMSPILVQEHGGSSVRAVLTPYRLNN